MKLILITVTLLITSFSSFAARSNTSFVTTNKFLSPLVGKHTLKGTEGCEDLKIEKIVERDRFCIHVGRDTYSVKINGHDIHPASYDDDDRFILGANRFESLGRWLMMSGMFLEKITYTIDKDNEGNITSFEHTIQRKKAFGRAKVYSHIKCEL